MRILNLMSDEGLRRLRASLRRPDVLTLSSAEEAESALRASRCDVVVIEPCRVREDTYTSLLALAARSGVRVLLYCALNPVAARRIVDAAGVLPVELLLFDADGETALLRRALAPTAELSVPSLTLRGLRGNVRRMRSPLAAATVSLFGGGVIPRSAEEFLSAFEEHPRTVQSWVERARVTCTSDLLWCSRIARLRDVLAVMGETLERIADRFGVRARTLTDECDRLVGLPPRTAVRELKPEEMARRLVESVTRH